MLDNKGLLNYIGITFNTAGKNTARNSVSFQCPFCGDRSDHMNLSIYGTCRCWRCGSYRLKELLDKLGFLGDLNQFFTQTGLSENAPRRYDGKFRPAKNEYKIPGSDLNVGAANYLKSRGFSPKQCKDIYGFRSVGTFGNKGDAPLAHRIIIPIYDKDGSLVSWVARDYTGQSKLRYMTPKPEQCVKTTKEVLYNGHLCCSDYAIVCEGVFDAIKMGIGAVATMGISLSGEQLSLLAKFKTLIWLWDNESHAQERAQEYAKVLRGCGKNQFFGFCPSADPGDLTYEQASELKQELLSKYIF